MRLFPFLLEEYREASWSKLVGRKVVECRADGWRDDEIPVSLLLFSKRDGFFVFRGRTGYEELVPLSSGRSHVSPEECRFG